jgi:hypothetical protein
MQRSGSGRSQLLRSSAPAACSSSCRAATKHAGKGPCGHARDPQHSTAQHPCVLVPCITPHVSPPAALQVLEAQQRSAEADREVKVARKLLGAGQLPQHLAQGMQCLAHAGLTSPLSSR